MTGGPPDGRHNAYQTIPHKVRRVSDLLDIAGRLRASTIAIPGGHRIEDLKLVESARDHGIVDRIVLIGDRASTLSAIEEVGIEISDEDIVRGETDSDIAARTVELVRAGVVDIVLKGGISTPVLNRHMLRTAVRPTVSLATLFDADPISKGRPIILTDAGFTTVCNFGRLVHIIENAVEVAHVVMGLDRPRVAVLSANEKQIPSLPSTTIGKALSDRNWRDAVVYGPLSFDLAVDPDSVAVKGLHDTGHALEVAGRADILVCPGIDSANILYKAITSMTKFGQAALAGITVGFSVPYVILSRADTVDTKLYSIALCSVFAQLSHRGGPGTTGSASAGTGRREGEEAKRGRTGGKRTGGKKAVRGEGIAAETERGVSPRVLDVARACADMIERRVDEISMILVLFDEDVSISLLKNGEILDSTDLPLHPDGKGAAVEGGKRAVDGGKAVASVGGNAQDTFPGGNWTRAIAGEIGRLYAGWSAYVEGVFIGGDYDAHGDTVAELRKRVAKIAPVYTVS
jgi:phosphate butyryltransferase